MAGSKQAKAALPYVQRIAENEYIQEQLRDAAVRLRQAYTRVAREGPSATEDKKLYQRVREAATSIRRAVGAIEEPPPKPTHRLRNTVLLALVAACAGFALKRARRDGAQQENATPMSAGVPESEAQPSVGEPARA